MDGGTRTGGFEPPRSTTSHQRWADDTAVERALRDAGWRVQFTSDRGESLLVVEPGGPGPLDEYYSTQGKR